MRNYLANRQDTMRALYAKEDYLGTDELKTDGLSIPGLFLQSTVNLTDEVLRNSILVFNNKAFVQSSKTENWKIELPDSAGKISMIEQDVNLQ